MKKTILTAIIVVLVIVIGVMAFTNDGDDEAISNETSTTTPVVDRSDGDVDNTEDESTIASDELTEYENNRFGFSFSYPESFTEKVSPQNNDGITLSSANGNVTIQAFGSHNVLDQSLEELESQTVESNFSSVETVETTGNAKTIYGESASGQRQTERIELQNDDVFTLRLIYDLGEFSERIAQDILNSFSIDAAEQASDMTLRLAMLDYIDRGQESDGFERSCDRVVFVERSVQETDAPLTAALDELFSLEGEMIDGWNNFIAKTNDTLSFDRAVVSGGTAEIYLQGELSGLAGVCDNPRAAIQIEETAKQFDTVNGVEIFLNGEPTDLTPDGRGV